MARPPKKHGKKQMRPVKATSTEVWSMLKKLELGEETYELTAKLRQLNACRAWFEAVGDSIARRSAATSLSRGTLHVTVESTTWRTELRFIENDIVTRVNTRYRELLPRDPQGAPVKRLQLTVGALPPPPKPEPPKQKLPPATDEEIAQVDERLRDVKDPEVRDAARKFLLTSLRAERAGR